MSEKPLDRLNYYNGQRLEAADLKLEQQYHIRVRRWLNKSLYTTGIARGLEVIKDPVNLGNVFVRPGMALDVEGREIILLDQKVMPAIGNPTPVGGQVDGNYLIIQYNEQATEIEQNGCVTRPSKKKGRDGSTLAWGGPAILRAEPILGWTDTLPDENSGKIVLAQVELDSQCHVRSVHPEVRRYVGAASDAKVRQYALEGEREVGSGTSPGDPTENPAIIYFHVRGRVPGAVSLFLRGDTFSTLRYTEMGRHTHAGNLTVATKTKSASGIDLHAHGLSQVQITGEMHTDGTAGLHTHSDFQCSFSAHTNVAPNPHYIQVFPGHQSSVANIIPFLDQRPNDANSVIQGASDHIHKLTGQMDFTPQPPNPPPPLHTHDIDVSALTISYAGANDTANPNASPPYRARNGSPLTYVNDLHILIDGHDHTDHILSQLKDSTGIDWPTIRLGNGTAGNHPFYIDPGDPTKGGTGEIKLDFLPGVSFAEGEHFIELRSSLLGNNPTGGRVLYNLYLE